MNSTKVLSLFKEITAVPRESGNPGQIVAFLQNFAAERGLACRVDDVNNVVIVREASAGREAEPTVVLQSHSDMVCEKTPESTHNFLTDPIPYVIEDGWMVAPETTLGADCGIGMATALAILEDAEGSYPRIEALFTSDEETGMDGAFGLKEGVITGSTLVNLDSEDEGEIFIGCAGGVDTMIEFEESLEAIGPGSKFLKVTIGRCIGGHSGDEIDKHRANAVQLVARYLYDILPLGIRLVSYNGGGRVNAISRDAEAVFAVQSGAADAAVKAFEAWGAAIKEEYANETAMTVEIAEAEPVGKALTEDATWAFASAMYATPHGPLEFSLSIPGLVETSMNLANVRTEVSAKKAKFFVGTSQRSSIKSAKLALANKVKAVWELIGADVEITGEYPGWNPNVNSSILKKAVEVYRACFPGEEPRVKAIHAGLECGLFLENFPHLDMISVGPTLRGVHAPGERLELASLEKFVKFIEALLR